MVIPVSKPTRRRDHTLRADGSDLAYRARLFHLPDLVLSMVRAVERR